MSDKGIQTNLEVRVGCMYSGKSSWLIQRLEESKLLYPSYKSFYIIHSADKEREILSHSNIFEKYKNDIEIHHVDSLEEFYSKYYLNNEVISCICFDETQFYRDSYNIIKRIINNKNVIDLFCAGLDGDYRQNKFPGSQLLDLVPLANSFEKLRTAYCAICLQKGIKTTASFTRLKKNVIMSAQDSILVGANESYLPVCRLHHHESN